MEETLFSNNALALVVAAFIFFITLFMVAKQWIGPSVVITLLIFSLLAGLVISNQDIIRNALVGTPNVHVKDIDVKMATFNENVLKAYDHLQAEMEIQKHKLDSLNNELQELKKEKTAPANAQ